MTSERGSRRARTTVGAAGTSALEERVTDLEDRVLRVEYRRPTMQSARGWFGEIVPQEATQHFRTAMREQLLGVRSLVDHWIGRMDRAPRSDEREEIRID
jgi:hypothetical protein